jgi:ribosomal protein S18 acetylase RimI-like enzyme
MTIREATTADEPTLRELWEEFEREVPDPFGEGETWEEEWEDTAADIADGVVLVAEDDEGAAGYLRLRAPRHGVAHLAIVHVRPRARRQGLVKALLREALARQAGQGVRHVSLDVLTANTAARAVWDRLGFQTVASFQAAPFDALETRLSGDEVEAVTFGSVHVQTDDVDAVARAVQAFMRRYGSRSAGSVVAPPRNGWTAVYDALADAEPATLRGLSRELSDRMGAVVLALGVEVGAVVRLILFEHGRIADEYASVPEYHGKLVPGDVVALRANPTVLGRLTGTEPAAIRAVARQATSPAELPPAPELLASIASVLGIEGGAHGYTGAAAIPDSVRIAHG